MNIRDTSTIVFAGLIAIGITALLALSIAHRDYDQALLRIEQSAEGLVHNRAGLQFAIYHNDRPYIDVALKELLARPAVSSAAVYRSDGKVIGGAGETSSSSSPALATLRGDAAIADTTLVAVDGNTSSSDTGFWSALSNSGALHLSVPVVTGTRAGQADLGFEDFLNAVTTNGNRGSQRVLGYVNLGIDRAALVRQSLLSTLPVVASLATVIVLGLLALFAISRRIGAPLKQLRRMAEDLSSGREPRALSVPRSSEFHDLADVVNGIVTSVKKRKEEAEVDKKLLSWKVDESHSKLSEQGDRLTKAAKEIDAAKSQLHRMAYYDPLTSLPNRTLFREKFQLLLRTRQRQGTNLALLFVNLNDFRSVNDTFGYSAGDLVLTEVGRRLAQCLRGSDVVGHLSEKELPLGVSRLGGDEFAIVLNNLDHIRSASDIAQRITWEVARPINTGGQEIVVSSRVGIAVAPDHGEDMEVLTRAAGIAMRNAEISPTGGFCLFSEDLEQGEPNDLQLESDLREAIAENKLQLYYQPQVDSVDGSILCAEALLRWEHPEHGHIPPGQFIPLAKKMGLLEELGHWAAREACRQLKVFRDQGLELPRIAINVSADELGDRFVENLQQALEFTEIGADCIELGLSEIVLMDEDSEGFRALQSLSAKGVHLSLDNFGISSTPLSHLNLYPLAELKIDRNIVSRCDTNKDNARLIRTILAIAESLNMRTVAEGVETPEVFNFLQSCGARAVQGFLFSEPVPAHELQRQLEIPWYFMNQIQDIKRDQQTLGA